MNIEYRISNKDLRSLTMLLMSSYVKFHQKFSNPCSLFDIRYSFLFSLKTKTFDFEKYVLVKINTFAVSNDDRIIYQFWLINFFSLFVAKTINYLDKLMFLRLDWEEISLAKIGNLFYHRYLWAEFISTSLFANKLAITAIFIFRLRWSINRKWLMQF